MPKTRMLNTPMYNAPYYFQPEFTVPLLSAFVIGFVILVVAYVCVKRSKHRATASSSEYARGYFIL